MNRNVVPGSLRGLRKGTNFAPMPNATAEPNTNPLASIPAYQPNPITLNHKNEIKKGKPK